MNSWKKKHYLPPNTAGIIMLIALIAIYGSIAHIIAPAETG